MEVSSKHLGPGDVVVLVERRKVGQPPVGTVGIITGLYSAIGGPAAHIQWDCDNPNHYHDRSLLECLRLHDEPDLDESDANLDDLFGSVIA